MTLSESRPATAMLVDAYRELGLPLDPTRVDSISHRVPGVRLEEARDMVASAVSRALADGVNRRDPRREPRAAGGGAVCRFICR